MLYITLINHRCALYTQFLGRDFCLYMCMCIQNTKNGRLILSPGVSPPWPSPALWPEPLGTQMNWILLPYSEILSTISSTIVMPLDVEYFTNEVSLSWFLTLHLTLKEKVLNTEKQNRHLAT